MRKLLTFSSLSPSKAETIEKLSNYHMAYTCPAKPAMTANLDLDIPTTDVDYESCNEEMEVTLFETLKNNIEIFNKETSFIFKHKSKFKFIQAQVKKIRFSSKLIVVFSDITGVFKNF
jgi:hypothetical protein